MDDASSQRLKLRKNLFTLLSSSTSPVVAEFGEDCEHENEQLKAAAILRESILLRSCAHALITRQVLFTSAEAGVPSSSWRIGVVGVGPSNIFLALLTAMSLPLVRIIITFTSHTCLPIPEPSRTLCCLFVAKRRRCAMLSGLS